MTTTRKTPTIAEFKRWLAKQPARRSFNYFDNDHCLLASFMTETDKDGNKWHCPGYNQVTCGSVSLFLPRAIDKAAVALASDFTVSQIRKDLNKKS